MIMERYWQNTLCFTRSFAGAKLFHYSFSLVAILDYWVLWMIRLREILNIYRDETLGFIEREDSYV